MIADVTCLRVDAGQTSRDSLVFRFIGSCGVSL